MDTSKPKTVRKLTPADKGSKPKGRVPARLTTSVVKPVSIAGAHQADDSAPRKRGDDVREKVLRAALECFGAFGYEGTSTRAVAARAQVTHTLVLYHFRSKEDLWISTMDNVLHNYADKIVEAEADHSLPAREGLQLFIESFVRMSARTPEVYRILCQEGNQQSARLQWAIDNHLRRHFNAAINLIRRGQMEGTVRQCDPARLYYLILGAATPFTIATEYRGFTGRDVFSETELLRTIAFIYEIVFPENA